MVAMPKTVSETTNQEIKELKTMLQQQNMNIKHITTQARTIATSSLTPDTALTDVIKQITEQQNEQFRRMMQDMMQSVFQQMFALIQMVLQPGSTPPRQFRLPESGTPGGYAQYRGPPNPHPILMTPPSHNNTNTVRFPQVQFPNHQSTVIGTA